MVIFVFAGLCFFTVVTGGLTAVSLLALLTADNRYATAESDMAAGLFIRNGLLFGVFLTLTLTFGGFLA